MKRVFMSAAVWLMGMAAYAQDTVPPFRVAPRYPVGGGEVTITYDNSLTQLAGSKTITGVIYVCDGEAWTAGDLDLELADGVWTATCTVPENSVLFACKFYGDDGEWDSGSAALSSYGMFVYGMNGDKPFRKRGTWMQRSLLFSKSLDRYAIPGYLKDEQKIGDRETFETMRWEAMTFPESAETLVYYAHTLMNSYEPGVHNGELAGDIDAMLSNEGTKEINLIRAAELSRTILRDEAKAKHIEASILRRYPDGLLARDVEIRKIFGERDADLAFRYLEEFVVRFPPRNFTKPQTRADETYYFRLFWTVLRNVPDKAYNLDVLAKYLPLMTYPDIVETYYRGINLPYDKRVKTAAELRPYADAIYAELIRRIYGGEDLYQPGVGGRYSPRQWRGMRLYNDGENILTHAMVLRDTGSPEQALEVLEQLKPVVGSKISVFNDTYAQLLAVNGYNDLVVPFIGECVRVDAATPGMLETLRADFAGKNPDGDFSAYLDGLRSDEHVKRMEEKLMSQLVREDVDLPAMESIRGGIVDLEKLKGKVIFLDFWATWCAPCMAAMPGVKMAMERYADNTDVAFFFVDTMERGGDPKEYVPQVMEMRGYTDFNVLYDLDGDGYGAFSKKFGMSGIPQKVIIDRDGYVRWVSGGYFGNPLELANEIGFIVDHLLNEKK